MPPDQVKEIVQLIANLNSYQFDKLDQKERLIRTHTNDKIVLEVFNLSFSPEILKKIQELHTQQVVKQTVSYENQELGLATEQIKQKHRGFDFN